MAEITELPDVKSEIRDQIVHGLRVIAEAIEIGIDDYDGVVVIGYYRSEEEAEIIPFNLYNPELAWIGSQVINHALIAHYEQDDD